MFLKIQTLILKVFLKMLVITIATVVISFSMKWLGKVTGTEDPEKIANFMIEVVIPLLFASLMVLGALYFSINLVRVIIKRDEYRRNHEVTKLIEKHKKEGLNSEEKARLSTLIEEGVVEQAGVFFCSDRGPVPAYRLSDRALDDFLR